MAATVGDEMAVNGLAIVSVVQFKTAIRQTGTDADVEALIGTYINGAAEWAEQLCRVGIVDTVESYVVAAPEGECPLVIEHRSPTIHTFKWRRAVDIAGIYTPAPVAPGEGGSPSTVAAPAGGWPAGALTIVFTRSMPADEVPGDIRSAMILWTKAAFDAEPLFGGVRSAAMRLLTPYTALGIGVG